MISVYRTQNEGLISSMSENEHLGVRERIGYISWIKGNWVWLLN